jgi:hypothetical protein
MEKSNFALRLLPSLHKAAQRVAEKENCSLNQLINVALAEKLAVMDAESWERRKQLSAGKRSSEILRRIAGNEPPREGDELPEKIGPRQENRGTKRRWPPASDRKTRSKRER